MIRMLRLAASEGLPGEHHFYVTFRTSHPGVAISPGLHARHPEEMTIVLQHQYRDLAVGEDAFSVTLRFGGAPERLHVPFAALWPSRTRRRSSVSASRPGKRMPRRRRLRGPM
mgnify:CR=1 FL=1